MTTTSDATVGTAVIGAGRMGGHHSRVYTQLPGVKLLAVCDVNMAAAQKLANLYHCQAFDNLDAMLATLASGPDKLTAATISTPTLHHWPIAKPLLERGIDLLVEKPLAPSVQEADAMVALANKHGRILSVGHTERFNPAFRALAPYNLKPQFIEIHRISPMTFRSMDVGVVLDMMIHDLDIVAHLVACPVTEVRAVGIQVIANHEDICNARLTFANGCIANITASRLALKTERKMRLFAPTAYVSVDYQKKSAVVITRTANEETLDLVRQQVRLGQIDLTQFDYTKYVKYEELKPADIEPIKAEQEAFIHSVRTRTRPPVNGEDGRAAVDLAARIAQAMQEHNWTEVPEVLKR